MKSHITYLTLVLLIFFSCKKEEPVPDYVISEDKMVQVLVDMELKQAEIKYRIARVDSGIQINYHQEFESTLNQHELTLNQFNKNLNYYCAKPRTMYELYIKVIEILSEEQTSV